MPTRVRTASGGGTRHCTLSSSRVARRGASVLQESFLAAAEASNWATELRKLISKEHPDAEVYSFPFLTPTFAAMLLAESRHYAESGL